MAPTPSKHEIEEKRLKLDYENARNIEIALIAIAVAFFIGGVDLLEAHPHISSILIPLSILVFITGWIIGGRANRQYKGLQTLYDELAGKQRKNSKNLKKISHQTWLSASLIFATFAGFSFVVMGIYYTGALHYQDQSINTALLKYSNSNIPSYDVALLNEIFTDHANQYAQTALIWLVVGGVCALATLLFLLFGFITEANK